MGAIISKGAGLFGTTLGSVFTAPVKTIFGKSCEGICSGTWDLICFIENLCIASLVKLLFVSLLFFIVLFFFYLLFKAGLFQCLLKSLCKMAWAACEAYWYAVEDISCFLWHKVKNTKRVYRGRRRMDFEEGYNSSSSSDPSMDDYGGFQISRRRRFVRDRRRDHMQRSLNPKRHRLKNRKRSHHNMKRKISKVSIHGKSGRTRNSHELQVRKTNHRRF